VSVPCVFPSESSFSNGFFFFRRNHCFSNAFWRFSVGVIVFTVDSGVSSLEFLFFEWILVFLSAGIMVCPMDSGVFSIGIIVFPMDLGSDCPLTPWGPNIGAQILGPKSHATDLGSDCPITRWGPTHGAQIKGPKSRATNLGPDRPLTRWGPNPRAQVLGPKSHGMDLGPDSPLTGPRSNINDPST